MVKNFKIKRDGQWISLTEEEENDCFDQVLDRVVEKRVFSYIKNLELNNLGQTEIKSLCRLIKNRIYDSIEAILPTDRF